MDQDIISQSIKNPITQKLWDKYVDREENHKNKYFEIMESLELDGFCLDPNCKCSNSMIWMSYVNDKKITNMRNFSRMFNCYKL